MANLLFITCHLPYPLVSGGRRREYELVTRLAREHNIQLMSFTETFEEDLHNAAVMEGVCRSVTVLPVTCSDDPSIPSEVRRHTCRDGSLHVGDIIAANEIQLIHVESFYLMQHVPEATNLPVFLQEQNVEYLLWKQRAETARHASEKANATWEYLRTIEAETREWQRADMCGAVTVDDLAAMRGALPSADIRLVPNGFDHLDASNESPKVVTDARSDTVVFVANFDYQPNVDAALYLVEKIWPLVIRSAPEVRLLLVGNAPPPAVVALDADSPNVEVTGRVPEVFSYLDRADVFLCPLRIGGGIKVKVLEALRRGKAIVTTSVGAQGIENPEAAMRVVDDPAGFAEATVELLRRPALRTELEKKARAAAARLPTWDEAAKALASCYQELLTR